MATWTNGTKASTSFNKLTRAGVALWSDFTATWGDPIYTWGGVGTAWVDQPLGYYQEITTESGYNLLLESGNELLT